MKVFQLQANQFVVNHNQNIYFQSYTDLIAWYNLPTATLFINGDWQGTAVTTRYFKRFINQFTHFKFVSVKQFEREVDNHEGIVIVDTYSNKQQ